MARKSDGKRVYPIRTEKSAMFSRIEDLKILSTALSQFIDNQCEIEAEEHGERPEVARARTMLDQVDEALLAQVTP